MRFFILTPSIRTYTEDNSVKMIRKTCSSTDEDGSQGTASTEPLESESADIVETNSKGRVRLEPMDRISLVRAGAKEQLMGPETHDVEQNVREIESILARNREIFGRCIWSIKSTDHELGNNENYYPRTTFVRYGFEVVQTCQVGKVFKCVTLTEQREKSFFTEPLSCLPSEVNPCDILKPKYKSGHASKFIDYDSFFNSSLILHDDVLSPFLEKLKPHLMDVQNCLSEVDKWLQEAHEITQFLETIFGKKLKNPKASDVEEKDCICPYGTHSNCEKCLNCNKVFGDHAKDAKGGWRCDTVSRDLFRCKEVHMLKECSLAGKHEVTFDVLLDWEKEKLIKFLEFLSCSILDP
mmetsp:Transcript_15967/g.33396  ORF Transcript_15967/g.33396 Transcript_15967/m.33396 type:complete len:352 (+) Transcript_15967:70-1125(+)